MAKLSDRKKQTKNGQKGHLSNRSKNFIENSATPGMNKTQALTIANMNSGDPKNGRPNNHTHVQAYNRSKILRDHIEARKKECLEYTNVTPEMVMGAVAMRAFGSIDGAFDENGMFDIKRARDSGAIHLIRRLELKKDGTFRVEFYSNESAQQQLANYMGMEKAPAENNDVKSLKAGVEQAAKAIAQEMNVPVDHHVRMLAWEKVERWVRDSRAGYSPAAIEEVRKLYAGNVNPFKRGRVRDADGGVLAPPIEVETGANGRNGGAADGNT